MIKTRFRCDLPFFIVLDRNIDPAIVEINMVTMCVSQLDSQAQSMRIEAPLTITAT